MLIQERAIGETIIRIKHAPVSEQQFAHVTTQTRPQNQPPLVSIHLARFTVIQINRYRLFKRLQLSSVKQFDVHSRLSETLVCIVFHLKFDISSSYPKWGQ